MKNIFIVLSFSILGLIIGTLIGGNYDATSLCLPNGCGYEATGTIGFFLGLFLSLFLVLRSRRKG